MYFVRTSAEKNVDMRICDIDLDIRHNKTTLSGLIIGFETHFDVFGILYLPFPIRHVIYLTSRAYY